MRHASVIALMFVIALPLLAGDRERILVPIAYTGPGAFSVTWVTSVIALNRGTQSWQSPYIAFVVPCSLPEGCILPQLEPGQVGDLMISGTYRLMAPTGLLLYVVPETATDVIVYGRIAAQPRQSVQTALPIVYEHTLQAGPTILPGVPHDVAEARTLLRIYDLDGNDGEEVSITARPLMPGAAEETATAVIRVPRQPGGDLPLYPGYAEVRLQEIFSGLSSRYITVQVEPLVPANASPSHLWAFVTVTDNRTNEVMVITPPM